MTDSVREQITERLGDTIFGEGEDELADVVAADLIHRDLKIALLEGPTTGGLIGHWMTENDDYAARLGFSRLFPTALSIVHEFNAQADDWELILREQGTALLKQGTADYVLVSSPAEFVVEKGIRKRQGSVIVLGHEFERSQDCSMAGNLAIFRQRAARVALNLLRLRLKEEA